MLKFRLAMALGRTVEELDRTMSHSEFLDWIAFTNYEPWGDIRADARTAVHMSQLAKMLGSKRGVPPDKLILRFTHTEAVKDGRAASVNNAKILAGMFGLPMPAIPGK